MRDQTAYKALPQVPKISFGGAWFHLSVEQFDMLHYAGMSIYKLGILLLNLVPYIALRICGRNMRERGFDKNAR